MKEAEIKKYYKIKIKIEKHNKLYFEKVHQKYQTKITMI